MAILVTGATGFLGRFVLLELLQQKQDVIALLRNPEQQMPSLYKWLQEKGCDTAHLQCIQGDLAQSDLAVSASDWQRLAQVDTLIHTGVLFAWNLSKVQAQTTNVNGCLTLIRLLKERTQLQRVILISGYMLTLKTHLQQYGIDLAQPLQSNWQQLYSKLGSYEASKIEAHFQSLALVQQLGLDWTVIHPATLIGTENTGEIAEHQVFTQIVKQINQGKMLGLPGSAQHTLPWVGVDHVVRGITQCLKDRSSYQQEILLVHPQSLSFHQVVRLIAKQLKIQPPRFCIPLPILATLLRWQSLAQRLNLSREMLEFLRTEPLTPNKSYTVCHASQVSLEEQLMQSVAWVKQHYL
ncbi:NAD-dependent epimerase/dehydratase family protein [Acinetobacter sp. ANC 4635]|uniref:SDR family oxidoreductase n=1 Tax=Acinetobacter sp. ANC 4635 TaxID=2529846 RepID=UPI00103B4924|nr:SDR family oxidoreductase [Acinetobacter sp. ANC 4635]TCB33084.1 NAD-dependent epimerase/dehydratase family protein [Acinetobacter sp. ANC 4635]